MLKNQKTITKSFYVFFSVFTIGIIGIAIRIYYTPQEIPLTLDAFRYFLYGMDASILGNLPINYNFPNTGWPLFLSIIFQVFKFENYLDYMLLQRICSEIFSVLTIIPLYYLAKRFFNEKLAIVGICFFIFSPFIVENSILGITDSLFIFLISSFLALFFSNKKKAVYSFFLLGLSAIIRYESLLLIVPTTIIFLSKYRIETNVTKFYFIGLALFVGILIPFAFWKIQMGIPDGLLSHLISGANVAINQGSINSETTKFNLLLGITSLPKFLAIISLPISFIFIPYAIISFIKNKTWDFRYLVLFGLFGLIPALYAYGRGYEETRYVFVIIPIFIIASLFLIEKIISKTNKKNLLMIIIIGAMISSSLIFIEFRAPDYEHEKESVEVSRFMKDFPGKINDYGNESYYIEVIKLEDEIFPKISTEIKLNHKPIILEGNSINEILKDAKDKDVKYLGITNEHKILAGIFNDEQKYDFLKKIFDSEEYSLKFKIKIFEIDYAKIDI